MSEVEVVWCGGRTRHDTGRVPAHQRGANGQAQLVDKVGGEELAVQGWSALATHASGLYGILVVGELVVSQENGANRTTAARAAGCSAAGGDPSWLLLAALLLLLARRARARCVA